MALIRYPSEAPVRSALVDAVRMVSLRWLQWFQLVGARIAAVTRLDVAYDPPNIAGGAAFTVTVTGSGCAIGDYVTGASFAPMTVAAVVTTGIRLMADVVDTDTIAVTFFNITAGAIDLDAGTIRLQLERAS